MHPFFLAGDTKNISIFVCYCQSAGRLVEDRLEAGWRSVGSRLEAGWRSAEGRLEIDIFGNEDAEHIGI